MEDRHQSSDECDDEELLLRSVKVVEDNKQKNELKEFIILFETCPSLWNPRDRHYLNTVKKNEDLDKLVPIYKNIKPNATRDDVRKKINSLRSNYRKELKKIENSKGSGRGANELYKPTSSTYYLLQFLAKIEQLKLKKDNGVHSENDSLVVSSITNESPLVKIKNNSRFLAKQNQLLNRACSLLSQHSVPSSQQDVNPLALVWSDKLKSLNPTQKLYAEKAIHDILFEAQLNNLHRHSVQIDALATHSSPAWSSPNPYIPSPIANEPENLIPDNCETCKSPDTSTTCLPVSHVPVVNLIPDKSETHTSPGTSTTSRPVLLKPESNVPFLHATGSTFTHRKPIITSLPKRKKPHLQAQEYKITKRVYKSTERTGF